jgi:putative thioredoxin
MSESPFIIKASMGNFADLIEISHQKPVVIDFWASWCAPCRTVKPLLEKLAIEYAGGFILALVNSDEEQALAQQYGVKSLPTIMVMKNGVPVQTVMGAQPEPALRAMIDPHLPPRASDNLRLQAKETLAQGNAEGAIELLKQAAEAEPENYKIHLDLVSIFVQQGQYVPAKELFHALGQEAKESKEGKPLGQLLNFVSIIADAPSPEVLAQQLSNNPQDALSLYQLASFAVLDRQFKDAIEMYLQLFKQDRNFGDGAAKSCLLTLFEMLNATQPDLVKLGRRQLQTLLF